MDQIKEVISDDAEKPEKKQSHSLKDLFGLGTVLILAARTEEKDRDCNYQGNTLCDVDYSLSLIEIDNEVGNNTGTDL